MNRRVRLGGFLAAAMLLPCAGAQAAPVRPNRNAKATVNIAAPAQVRNLGDLDFGCLSVTTAGTATINPNTDVLTTTGGVVRAGCLPHAAQFEAVAPIKSVVLIKVTNKPVTLTRVGGTETMALSNLTVSGTLNRTVNIKELIAFKVGGTLAVGAKQAAGTHVGTFDVDLNFN